MLCDITKKVQLYNNKKNKHKIVIISFPVNLNRCFGCSKEPSHWDGSFEYHNICFGWEILGKQFHFAQIIWWPGITKGEKMALQKFMCLNFMKEHYLQHT